MLQLERMLRYFEVLTRVCWLKTVQAQLQEQSLVRDGTQQCHLLEVMLHAVHLVRVQGQLLGLELGHMHWSGHYWLRQAHMMELRQLNLA